MNALQASPAELQFADGEAVLLYHQLPTKRIWHNDEETWHKAKIEADRITFTRLNPDGTEFNPEKAAKVTRSEYELATVAFTDSVQSESGEWTEYRWATPTVETLNEISERYLRPLGAHALPARLMDGDGNDELFKPSTISAALDAGFTILGTTARYLLHDGMEHGFGMASIEATTMGVSREICHLQQDGSLHEDVALILAGAIAYGFDNATYEDPDDGIPQVKVQRRDPLLEGFLADAFSLTHSVRKAIVEIMKDHNFVIRCDNSRYTVKRPDEVLDYYRRLADTRF